MSKPQKTLRQQLIEARDKVQRRIEILTAGPASGDVWARRSDSDGLIAELQGELEEINKSLAALPAGDA